MLRVVTVLAPWSCVGRDHPNKQTHAITCPGQQPVPSQPAPTINMLLTHIHQVSFPIPQLIYEPGGEGVVLGLGLGDGVTLGDALGDGLLEGAAVKGEGWVTTTATRSLQ